MSATVMTTMAAATPGAGPPSTAPPIAKVDRLDVLDVLRGIALLGMYVVHLCDYAGVWNVPKGQQPALWQRLEWWLLDGRAYTGFEQGSSSSSWGAAIGIYGVMSYAVTQRTQEIGIRMALGADRRAVLRMILRQSGLMVLAGVVIGGIGALGTGRVLVFQLFEVSARDPLVLAGVAVILVIVSIAAVLVPARRATAVDPIIALRAP